MKNRALLSVAVLSALAVACGSTVEQEPAPSTTPPVATAPAPTTPAKVAPATPAVDHGKASTTYPAFTPAMGQIATSGGSVLKNPVIVTVTWPGDTQATDLETFGDNVGAGAYWTAVTSEYGAAAAVSGAVNHVRLADAAPATFSDTDLNTFVANSLAAADTTWPTPATGDPVYILYLPRTTTLTLQGESACSQGVGGYHDSTKVNGKSVAYAIIPRCGGSQMDETTIAASHELAEATTDPYPRSRPAFSGFRDQDLAWEFFQQFQSENGDACEFYRDSDLDSSESGVGYTVQRQWSNKSAAAGHDPCVPEFKGEVYFNVTPLSTEDITVDLSALGGDSETVTSGYKVKVGATRTIPLGFYSDAAAGDWDIKAVTGGIAGGRSSSSGVDLELDVTSGTNGQKAYLTVTVNTAGKTNSELITIVSTRNGTSHYMPILIGN